MQIKDFKLNFNNEIEFSNKILKLNGLNSMSVNYQTKSTANGHGVVIVGKDTAERIITLEVEVEDDKADQLQRYFIKKEDHVLFLGDRKINCKCELSELYFEKDNLWNTKILKLAFICQDPYFYDVSDFGKDLSEVKPLFGFPWSFTKASKVSCGYRMFTNSTIFENKGDGKIGLKMKFIARYGDAQNVSISNLKTGQFVKVKTNLKQGDVLEISTITGEKYIKKNGVDIFNTMDKMSDFFELETGNNFLEFNAQTGVTSLEAYLYYTPVYANGLVIEK